MQFQSSDLPMPQAGTVGVKHAISKSSALSIG
jgi:hypothetical protein